MDSTALQYEVIMSIYYDSFGNVYGNATDFSSTNIPTFNRVIYTEVDTSSKKNQNRSLNKLL